MFEYQNEERLQKHLEQFVQHPGFITHKVRRTIIHKIRTFFKLADEQAAVNKALELPDEDIVVFVDKTIKEVL